MEFWDYLPKDQQLIVDFLRQIIKDNSPTSVKEKLSYNVPFFYGKKSICLVWPAAVPRGGIKEGVLLGFWYGYKLPDKNNYLKHGTNKQIFYKIYKSIDDIDTDAVISVLQEALDYDARFK